MNASADLIMEIFDLLYCELKHRVVNHKNHKEDPIILYTKHIDFLCNLITTFAALETCRNLYMEEKIDYLSFIDDVKTHFDNYYDFCEQIKKMYESGEDK